MPGIRHRLPTLCDALPGCTCSVSVCIVCPARFNIVTSYLPALSVENDTVISDDVAPITVNGRSTREIFFIPTMLWPVILTLSRYHVLPAVEVAACLKAK